MLKFVFWTLLFLNVVLFAYGQGFLGKLDDGDREPGRMQNQLAADRLKLVPEPVKASPPDASNNQPLNIAQQLEGSFVPAGCTEIGPLKPAEARRFQARLDEAGLGGRLSRMTVPFQEVTGQLVYIPQACFVQARLDEAGLGGRLSRMTVPFQEVTGQLVYIPQASREAAARKVAELRGQGISNLFIMQGEPPFRHGISLGVFKSEESAHALMASLNKQGVRGARMVPRGPMVMHTTYQIRAVDEATRARILEIAERSGEPLVKACG